MAHTVHGKMGLMGFVLFSGISIVPRRIRIDDVVVRLVAAMYLRRRSAHFRAFSRRVAKSHHAAWFARIVMVVSTFSSASFDFAMGTNRAIAGSMIIGGVVVGALHVF